ncbi:HNH endonuclease [Nocardioides mangrovicus]|uniref:HNH endonuclease n=1 Tax=Nocardioides mangrovicus TaxID=2478913 RepID=A0A3L8P2Z2_9ACTN|nr:HNH endonuclease signature motif containing protein [Nocardioides mangrovicus]RLV48939.1 HNH endonuclease [Nocardioides mangrovicus]
MSTTNADDVRSWLRALPSLDVAGLSDAERVDLLTALESLKGGAAAAQARVIAELDASQRASASTREEHAAVSRSVAAMVGLARHESPHAGRKYLGLATALVHEMPCTMAALSAGEISEFKAIVMVKETAVLTLEHRAEVDRRLADKLAVFGVGRLGKAARLVGYEVDRESPLKRVRGAESDRRVTIRPAPDTMTWVGAFLPVAQGVGVYAALKAAAASARAVGDPRSEGQVMADTLFARVTGLDSAADIGVEVNVVMGQAALFEGSDEPAWVAGYGPVPAVLARRLVREADRAWARRLYAHPASGELVTMDARRRSFSAGVRKLGVLRDDICATPWCDAPAKHADHITAAADGGPSTSSNEQGLCEACNYRKELPGWSTTGSASRVTTTTPTGHAYESRPPPLPGTQQVKVIHIVGPALEVDWAPTG